jgi:thiamine kinase-like enzyme
MDNEKILKICRQKLLSEKEFKNEDIQLKLIATSDPGYTSKRYVLKINNRLNKEYFLKVFEIPEFSSKKTAQVTKREYFGLKILNKKFSEHDKFYVPEPIDYSLSNHFLIMEHLEGINLSTMLRNYLSRWGTLKNKKLLFNLFFDIGRMLYTLQNVSYKIFDAPFKKTNKIHDHYLEILISSVNRCIEKRGNKDLLGKFQKNVEEKLNKIFSIQIEICYQHHDYRLQNFIIKDKISLVDFMLFHHGSPYFDIAAFISSTRFFYVWNFLLKKELSELEKCFMNGYLSDYNRPIPFSHDNLKTFLDLLMPWNYNLYLLSLESFKIPILSNLLYRQLEQTFINKCVKPI